jgi:hypothetical protein
MNKLPMTAAGRSALEDELKQRIRVERPHFVQRIQEAIADDSNLAENSEYHAAKAEQEIDLLQIEWVKWGRFSQVECDSKGFFVNVTVTSSRHVCAHAKIDQDEAPER